MVREHDVKPFHRLQVSEHFHERWAISSARSSNKSDDWVSQVHDGRWMVITRETKRQGSHASLPLLSSHVDVVSCLPKVVSFITTGRRPSPEDLVLKVTFLVLLLSHLHSHPLSSLILSHHHTINKRIIFLFSQKTIQA